MFYAYKPKKQEKEDCFKMTIQEIEERKAELKQKILDAKTSEELEELRADIEEINAEVPEEEKAEEVKEEEPKAEEPAEEVKEEIKEEKPTVEEERELIRVNTEEVVPVGNLKEERTMVKEIYNAETRAWAKKLMGRNDFDEEEKRALGDAVGTTATTFVQSSADAQGINNVGLFIPKSIRMELEERAVRESPIWAGIRKLRVRGNVDVPYLYAGDDANWYAELAPTANEGQEFKAITLIGREHAKNIEITWKADQMTAEGFIDYIVDELYDKMYKAKVTAVIYGTGNTYNQPTGITNTLVAVTTGATPLDTIADTKATLSADAKVGAGVYVSPAVADAIRYYKNSEGNYPFVMGLPAGIEEDPFLQNNDIVVGNLRNYVWNEQEEIRIDRDINMPKRTVMYGAYQVCDGGAKVGAFAYGQYSDLSA